MLAPMALATTLILAPPASEPPKAPADAPRIDPAWKPLGPSLWFDPQGKRVVLRARVVLREGPLEHLLCLKGTKEHEAILATDAVPYQIHATLIRAGAAPGHPVRFLPKFEPPAGSPIAIELQWRYGGTTHRVDARQWIKDERRNSVLDTDWVFAGSELVEDPMTKKTVYTADDGDLITVANFINAILDLPFASTANDADRTFVANTDRIPPRGTVVMMFLRPRPTSSPTPRR